MHTYISKTFWSIGNQKDPDQKYKPYPQRKYQNIGVLQGDH